MDNSQRAIRGSFALAQGTTDQAGSTRERATDAVANILHYLAEEGEDDPQAILNSAAAHYLSEREPAEQLWAFDAEVQVRGLDADHARENAEALSEAVSHMDCGAVYLLTWKPRIDPDTLAALREVAAGKLDQFSVGELEDIGLSATSQAGRTDDDALMRQAEQILEAHSG